MPKLPTIRPRFPVQTLGRENLGQPLRLARAEASVARAQGELLGAVGKLAGDFVERENERAVEEALVEYERRQGEWMAELENKRFYGPDEIPDELGINKSVSRTDAYGRVREVPREHIPAEEVAVGLYDQRMSGLHESLLANLSSDRQREMFASRADLQTARGRSHVVQRSARFARESFRDQRIATIESLMLADRWDEAMAAVAETSPEVLNETDRAKLEAEIMERRVTQPIYRAKANGDEASLKMLLADLRNPEVMMPGVSAKRRAQLAQDVATDINTLRTARERQTKDWQENNFHVMRGRIARGDLTIGYDAIDQALANGQIDIGQWDILTRYWKSERGDKADRADLLAGYPRGVPLAANDGEHRKAADEWYESLERRVYGQGQPDADTERAFNAHVGSFINERKYIPQGVKNRLFQLTNSPDAKDLDAGVRLYDTLHAMAPGALARLGDDFKWTKVAAGLRRYGRDPAQIISILDNAKKATPEDMRANLAAFRSTFDADARNEYLNDQMFADETGWEGFAGRNPAVSAQIRAYFTERAEFYAPMVGGNYEAALQAGWGDVVQAFGVTALEGERRVAMLAPEHMYGQENTPLLREDLNRQLGVFTQTEGGAGDRGLERKYSADDVIVVMDPTGQSDFRSGRGLSYRVLDAETMQPVLRPDGHEFRWTPDLARTRLAAQEARAAEAAERRRTEDVFRSAADVERAEQLVQSRGLSMEAAMEQAVAEREAKEARRLEQRRASPQFGLGAEGGP